MDAYKEDYVNEMVAMMGGTRRLSLMIGAKDFVKGEDEEGNPFFMFRHMKSGKNKANKFCITYNMADDLYSIDFIRVWGADYRIMSHHEMVFADMVHDLFRDKTGLVLSI